MYALEPTKSFLKSASRLSKDTRIKKKLLELKINPELGKHLKGFVEFTRWEIQNHV